jgi:glycerol-3-phosphate acyltransferase PlsX
MPRLILDAIGGELGPRSILEGAVEAFPRLEGELVLVGREAELQSVLSEPAFAPIAARISAQACVGTSPACRLRIVDCAGTPAEAIQVAVRLAAEGHKNNLSSAFVSAGNSTAVLEESLQHLGLIPGVSRPAFAVRLPNASGKDCILLDTGASVECRPQDLRDFAVMGALYAQINLEKGVLPRVAILGTGNPADPGSELTRSASAALQCDAFFQTGPRQQAVFAGFADGTDLFKGQVDVAVADGFLGRTVLRSMEGATSAVIAMVQEAGQRTLLGSLGFRLASDVLAAALRGIEYSEHVGAVILGTQACVTLCQDRSNARAIHNALLNTQHLLKHALAEKIARHFCTDHSRNISETAVQTTVQTTVQKGPAT